MVIGGKKFDINQKTYVMGILNVTPDSFSDGGKFYKPESALVRAKWMMEEGAAIIDVGGESTRPGYQEISELEEIERIVPIVERIKNVLDVPVSVDTYKPDVARAALKAGADMINDIWGLKRDERMADIIAEFDVPCVLMHNRDNKNYDNFLRDVFDDLQETINIAKKHGIKDDKIIIDPGIGFAKTQENNLEVLHYMDDFHRFGYPLLLGCSRKSVIGNVLKTDVSERMEGTLVTTMLASLNNYTFVRVHDITENIRTINMTEAIKNAGTVTF